MNHNERAIMTVQEYLYALKSQEEGRLVVAPKKFMTVDELDNVIREMCKDFVPPDGLSVQNMDDYLREYG